MKNQLDRIIEKVTNGDRPVFYVSGSFDPMTLAPQSVEIETYVRTAEEAAEIVASLPKSVKAHASTFYSRSGVTFGTVTIRASLTGNGINKGINETGLRRYRSAIKAIEKLGFEITDRSIGISNAYKNQAEIEAALLDSIGQSERTK